MTVAHGPLDADGRPVWELRLGRYQDVLADVEPHHVITDPPYSDRTHAGHDKGTRYDGSARHGDRKQTRGIPYRAWSADEMRAAGVQWCRAARGWIVVLTDDVSIGLWKSVYDETGRITFAATPIVEIGSRVRLAGDGPSSWSCYAVASRPRARAFQRWGTLPGAYVYTGHGDRVVMGGKRVDCMRAIVRDYSRPGDLICDPCAGGATTLLAAAMEGRRAIGAECDPATFERAVKRLRKGFTPDMFSGVSSAPTMEQMGLLGEE